MKNRMTIADIARDLKLDYSTVLRILNQDFKKHKFNSETVKKVVEYAEKHNLVKNRVASALKRGKSHLVGMLIPDLSASPFFAELASLISRKLLTHSYKLIISDTMDSSEQELKNINDFLSYQVDGIILSPFTRLSKLNNLIKNTPIVIVDNDLYPEFDFVGLDNSYAAEVLIAKLLAGGAGKAGLVFHYHAEKRVQAFLEEAKKAGLSLLLPPVELVSRDLLELQCEYFLKSGCDTIIGVSSSSLKAIVEYVHIKKLKVPEDVKLAGIDRVPLINIFMPQILTLGQPIAKYAEEVVRILLDKMEGIQVSDSSEKIIFKGELDDPDKSPEK